MKGEVDMVVQTRDLVEAPLKEPVVEVVKPSVSASPDAWMIDGVESLDELDDLEFLLEEIENKIAPLALA